MPDQYTCIQCGQRFIRLAPRTPPTHCSRSCAARTATGALLTVVRPPRPVVVRDCAGCRSSFTVEKPSSKQHYCSHRCFTKSNVGDRHFAKREHVSLTCKQCGLVFDEYPYRADRRFCSHACYAESLKRGRTGPTTPAICTVCSASYLTWEYRLRDGNTTCSAVCASKAKERGEHRQCAVCGDAFYASRQQITNGGGRYCSIPCRSTGTADLTRRDRQSVRYRTWRRAILERDAFICQRCHVPGGRLHAHHVEMWARRPDLRFEISNGLTLHEECHRLLHIEQRTWHFD